MSRSQLHSKTAARQQSGGLNVVARLVSDLANPLVIPPLVFMTVAYLLSVSAIEMGWITSFSLIFFSIIPLGIAISLLRNGQVESLDVPQRTNRNKLFLYAILSSTLGSLLIISLYLGKQPLLVETALIFLANPIFGYLINQRIKISIHTAAVSTGGIMFLMLFIQQTEITIWLGALAFGMLLVLLPLMIWARFRLAVHSFSELIGGALAGVLLTTIQIGIMKIIW